MKKLVDVLVSPNILLELPLSNLSSIISEAKYFNMLSQLKYLCQQNDLWHLLPSIFQTHLDSASFFYASQRMKLDIEIEEISKELSTLNIDWMYLKGSAYHLNNMVGFTGRTMSDIDLLVTEEDLPKAEKKLHAKGWVPITINNYDENFYRSWSQEIPPLKHIFRQVKLDVHFNILPKTIKEALDNKYLFEQSMVISQKPYIKILKPHAMLVHSAIHLFYESEYHKGLRDLYDIAIFIKEYGSHALFWENVIELQNKIGNQRSLYYALRYCHKVYGVEIPLKVMQHYDKFKPNALTLALIDFCFLNIFTSMFPPNRKLGYGLSHWVLYLRGHLKRMPTRLLIPHLTKKSLDRFKKKEESPNLV